MNEVTSIPVLSSTRHLVLLDGHTLGFYILCLHNFWHNLRKLG